MTRSVFMDVEQDIKKKINFKKKNKYALIPFLDGLNHHPNADVNY